MYHKPDIFLVDAHAESYGSYDDLQLVLHPFLLYVLALVVIKLCMVVVAPNVIISLQYLRKLLAFFPRYAVYNAALASESSAQHLHEVVVDVFELLLVSDLIYEVRPVEAALEEHTLIGNA